MLFGPSGHSHQQLPRFLKPLPFTVDEQDIEYLRCKGALALPTAQLEEELLNAYITFVHPAKPILDLKQLINTLDSNNGSGNQMSLLLYQAIMSASVGFVDSQILRNFGYSSKREARKEFYAKVTVRQPHVDYQNFKIRD
jgi:hypothetical protein